MSMKKMIIAALLSSSFVYGHAQHFDAGKKMYYSQRYLSANNEFQQEIVANPNDGRAYFWQILSLSELNQMADAKKIIAKIPQTVAGNPYINIARGFIALSDKDSIGAKKYFIDAIGNERRKDPAIQLAVAIANVESNNGDNLYAVNLLEEASKKDKKDAELFITEGDAYRKLLDGSKAFASYNNAIEVDKSNPVAYYRLGKIFQTQNNRDLFLSYFNKAVEYDPKYAPAYYQLFYSFYKLSAEKAKSYLDLFIANSDNSTQNDYLKVDMYYLLKNYADAVKTGNQIVNAEGNKTEARVYKLLAYCYDEQNNLPDAETQLKKYFSFDTDTAHYAAQDFDLMGKILENKNQMDEAALWYQKAFARENDKTKQLNYATKLSAFYKKQRDFVNQSLWLKELYKLKTNPNNVDLFNLGVAEYSAKQYKVADSVFAIYQNKYPEQPFGYYWRAKSNAAIDTAMETGIAVPHYENLITVASKELTNATYKKWVIQAYGYIAAFKANKDKQYDSALVCYNKILSIDSTNADALRYKDILEKMIQNNHPDSSNNSEVDENKTMEEKKDDKKGNN